MQRVITHWPAQNILNIRANLKKKKLTFHEFSRSGIDHFLDGP